MFKVCENAVYYEELGNTIVLNGCHFCIITLFLPDQCTCNAYTEHSSTPACFIIVGEFWCIKGMALMNLLL